MIELIGPQEYYSKIPKGGSFVGQLYCPGHFFWAPVQKLVEKNPTAELKAKYNPQTLGIDVELAQASWGEFEETREPIHEFGLKAKERALIIPAKRRPVILLTKNPVRPQAGKRKFGEGFLVAPIYSFEGDEQKTPYPDSFIERVKAYTYSQFFYLPACTDPPCKEGFVRFDRVQSVNDNWLEHRGMSLSLDILEYFQAWLWYYLGSDLKSSSPLLFEYREQKMRALAAATS